MNKPIRTMSIFCMLLFAALLLNSTYLQYVDAGSLNSRSDNKRVRDAEFARKRGAIVAGGTSIAESRKVDDQYTYQRVYKQPAKYARGCSSTGSWTCSATASPRAVRCR